MLRRVVCLLLLLLAAAALHAQPQPGPVTVVSQVRTDDGQTLAVWSRVPAQPRGAIVLVHGRIWSALPNFDLQVLGEPRDARSVLAALAQAGFAAYAVDLRGYGGSPRDRTGWNTPARAVADVRSVLAWVAQTHPDVPPPALLGYSNGTRVALLLAQQQPQAMSALVLFGFPDDVDAPPAPAVPADRPLRAPTTAAAAGEDFIAANAAPPAVRAAYVAQALWLRTRCAPTGARWSSSPSIPSRSQRSRYCCCAASTSRSPPRQTTPISTHVYAAQIAAG